MSIAFVVRLRRSVVLLSLAGVICSFLVTNLLADSQARAVAEHLVERAKMQRGICAVLGGDPAVALEMARLSELLIHVRQPQREMAQELMRRADEAGYGIQRLAAESGPVDQLPYANRLIDLVVAPSVTGEIAQHLAVKEILRVLRPDGTALLGLSKPAEADKFAERARDKGAHHVTTWADDHGHWVQFHAPPLAGSDDWSHWEKGPDNNPVSEDSIIRAPYMTQFLTGPFYIGMPSVTTAAGGRTFLAIGHIAGFPQGGHCRSKTATLGGGLRTGLAGRHRYATADNVSIE